MYIISKYNNSDKIIIFADNIQLPNAYSPGEIRRKKSCYLEEYAILKNEKYEIIGQINIAVDVKKLILKLNMLYIEKNYVDDLILNFYDYINLIMNSVVISPKKLRLTISSVSNEYENILERIGFRVEAQRFGGPKFQKRIIDYVWGCDNGECI